MKSECSKSTKGADAVAIMLVMAAGMILLLLGPRARAQMQSKLAPYTDWGMQTLGQIETDFAIPGRGLYAEESVPGQAKSLQPAYMWGCGVQLSALAAAARLEPDVWKPSLARCITALDAYRAPLSGVTGYCVQPHQDNPDRFYDDNEWVVLALVEAYEVTGEESYRARAVEAFDFVLSGEDTKIGGGIYWHEADRTSKNACSNAPAAAAALRLYQITHKSAYLEIGKRLTVWMNAHLQDKDGLFFDNVRLDGRLEKTKWSYNSALMIRANCLLYELTKDKSYLNEAERIARAAESHWIHPDTGGIADGAAFAHLLLESFLYLYEQDADPHWLKAAQRAVLYVHDHVRDAQGKYGEQWAMPQTDKLRKVSLLSQASAARAFLMTGLFTKQQVSTAPRAK